MAGAAALSPGGDPNGPSVNGYLKEVGGDTLVLERYHLDLSSPPPRVSIPSGPQLKVTIAKDAKLWRAGPVALSDFQRGDQLIAYVNWQDNALVAWGVEPLYQWVEAIVDSRSGGRLRTSKGTVVINEHTVMSSTANGSVKSLSALGKGNRIAANCMHDPASGDFIAGVIGAP